LAELTEILKALGDETRFNILTTLLCHDYCVGALAKKLKVTESAISQHLRILRNAGIVRGDKRGYYTHYRVDREALKKLAGELVQLSDTEPLKTECRKHQSDNHSCCRKEAGNCDKG
jgi:ArsR family transcriptional regulator, arsenate/arsenite/antimonite-responsive transcriptional repressor